MIKGCLGMVLHQPARRVKSAKVRDGGKKDGTLVLISEKYLSGFWGEASADSS